MNMDHDKTLTKLSQAAPMLAAIGEEMSFTKAAERLKVDQSAVSHRARALEEALGFTLFDRTTRSLKLTERGQILCDAASQTVATWETALDKLDRSGTANMIQLSMASSLAMKWLIPVLPSARTMDLTLSVDVNEDPIGFQANEADAAIRFGQGPYPGLHSTLLSPCWLQPVVSPGYLEDRANDTSLLTDAQTSFLADRRGETDDTDFSWQFYFSKIEQAKENFTAESQFDRADLMLQAVIGGMGVGLGRTLLFENDVDAGYLKPIGAPVRMRSGYWLVCLPAFAETDRFERLRDWLKAEIRSTVG